MNFEGRKRMVRRKRAEKCKVRKQYQVNYECEVSVQSMPGKGKVESRFL